MVGLFNHYFPRKLIDCPAQISRRGVDGRRRDVGPPVYRHVTSQRHDYVEGYLFDHQLVTKCVAEGVRRRLFQACQFALLSHDDKLNGAGGGGGGGGGAAPNG